MNVYKWHSEKWMRTTCCQQQHCSGRITTRRLIRRPQYCTGIAHRCHSAATMDRNIILHQTMRQISTLTIKQFLNTLRGWTFKGSMMKSTKVENVRRKIAVFDQYTNRIRSVTWQFQFFFLYRPINVVF